MIYFALVQFVYVLVVMACLAVADARGRLRD